LGPNVSRRRVSLKRRFFLDPNEEQGRCLTDFAARTRKMQRIQDESIPNNYFRASHVRVITFDLDNTIWRTGPTIQAANDALAEYLDAQGIVQPDRVEKIMGQLFKQSKAKYAPMSGDDPKAPVLLTELRKDAIRFLLEHCNGFSPVDAIDFADQAFDLWTKARHEALPDHFASNVVESLANIKKIRADNGQPVLIGAITDGNSDPKTVPELCDFFDFVVNAENVGVAKPDKRVYTAAIKVAARHPYLQDIFINVDLENEDLLQDIVGPWWIHVGDDFMKDIVAAKDLGMRTIWAQELVQEKLVTIKPQAQSSSKSVEDFVKEISEKLAEEKVVKMCVGTEDYLAGSLQEDFADVSVASFEQIAETLIEWHRVSSLMIASETEVITDGSEHDGLSLNRGLPIDESHPPQGRKFCLSCGLKLPPTAKFCSSCGEKQTNPI
jgi:putative hydrolase of the HAD superfamily